VILHKILFIVKKRFLFTMMSGNKIGVLFLGSPASLKVPDQMGGAGRRLADEGLPCSLAEGGV
jgi:hypothetical protein